MLAMTGFPQEGIHNQTPAHPDSAMDAPHRKLDAPLLERLAPGEDVLVDAVDQRAIQVKQQGWSAPDGAFVGARLRRRTLMRFGLVHDFSPLEK